MLHGGTPCLRDKFIIGQLFHCHSDAGYDGDGTFAVHNTTLHKNASQEEQHDAQLARNLSQRSFGVNHTQI